MDEWMKTWRRAGWHLKKQAHLESCFCQGINREQSPSTRTQTDIQALLRVIAWYWVCKRASRSGGSLRTVGSSSSTVQWGGQGPGCARHPTSLHTSHLSLVCFFLKMILDAFRTPNKVPPAVMQWSVVDSSLPSQAPWASESDIRQGLPASSAHWLQVTGSISFPIISNKCSDDSEVAFLVLS